MLTSRQSAMPSKQLEPGRSKQFDKLSILRGVIVAHLTPSNDGCRSRNSPPFRPLTIYLEGEQLVAVEKLARAAGILKSAWAGQVLGRALSGQGTSSDRTFDQIIKIRATLDALVATQPQKDELRKRIDVKLQRYKAEAQGSLAL